MGPTLWSVLGSVPDLRDASGRRYPLASVLAIGIAAVLAGRDSLAGIFRWGRKLDRDALQLLGIDRPRAPCYAAYHYIFRSLDVAALERALASWVRGSAVSAELGQVALDGKRLRGSRQADNPGVHLLAAFAEDLKGVIGEFRVAPDSNEIIAALELLQGLSLEGAIVSEDAIFAQRAICREIKDRGGDYFFTVKVNQPRLRDDIALYFEKEATGAPEGDDSPLCGL
jgi:hypothetical protein